MFTQAMSIKDNPQALTGISVITTPGIRWGRRDIKTVGLLAACMAKMLAKKEGANDAWMVEDGNVTEGSSNNAYIVTPDNTLITRHLGSEILSGITRKAVLKLAQTHEIKIEERGFTPEEAYAASEAFVTSATTLVMPVISIDNKPVGDGKPGPITQKLRELYIQTALEEID